MVKRHLRDIFTQFTLERSNARVKRPDGKIQEVKITEIGLKNSTTSILHPLLLRRIRSLPTKYAVELNYQLGYGSIQQSYSMLRTANLGLINAAEGFPLQPIAVSLLNQLF